MLDSLIEALPVLPIEYILAGVFGLLIAAVVFQVALVAVPFDDRQKERYKTAAALVVMIVLGILIAAYAVAIRANGA